MKLKSKQLGHSQQFFGHYPFNEMSATVSEASTEIEQTFNIREPSATTLPKLAQKGAKRKDPNIMFQTIRKPIKDVLKDRELEIKKLLRKQEIMQRDLEIKGVFGEATEKDSILQSEGQSALKENSTVVKILKSPTVPSIRKSSSRRLFENSAKIKIFNTNRERMAQPASIMMQGIPSSDIIKSLCSGQSLEHMQIKVEDSSQAVFRKVRKVEEEFRKQELEKQIYQKLYKLMPAISETIITCGGDKDPFPEICKKFPKDLLLVNQTVNDFYKKEGAEYVVRSPKNSRKASIGSPSRQDSLVDAFMGLVNKVKLSISIPRQLKEFMLRRLQEEELERQRAEAGYRDALKKLAGIADESEIDLQLIEEMNRRQGESEERRRLSKNFAQKAKARQSVINRNSLVLDVSHQDKYSLKKLQGAHPYKSYWYKCIEIALDFEDIYNDETDLDVGYFRLLAPRKDSMKNIPPASPTNRSKSNAVVTSLLTLENLL